MTAGAVFSQRRQLSFAAVGSIRAGQLRHSAHGGTDALFLCSGGLMPLL